MLNSNTCKHKHSRSKIENSAQVSSCELKCVHDGAYPSRASYGAPLYGHAPGLTPNVRLAMEKLARDRHSRLATSSVTKKNVLCNWQQVYADELESILEVSVSLIKMPFFRR